MDINIVIIGGFVVLGLILVFALLVEAAQKRELKQIEEARLGKQTSGANRA